MVDDGVGVFEACVADFLALVAVVTHAQVQGVVAVHDESQQFLVAVLGGLLVFVYRRAAFPLADAKYGVERDQAAVPKGVAGHFDVFAVCVSFQFGVIVGFLDDLLCVGHIPSGFLDLIFFFHTFRSDD